MKNKILLYFLLPSLILLASCSKENSDVFTPHSTPTGADTNWVSAITASLPIEELQQQLMLPAKLDSFEASTGGTMLFNDGLMVTVPANAIVANAGSSVTGKVYIQALLVKKRGDMIKVDKPTISFGRQLISGGEIFVRLFQSGNELALAPGKKVAIRYNDVTVSPFMSVFYGDESNIERFNWTQGQDTLRVITQGNVGYEILASSRSASMSACCSCALDDADRP